ncbi:hypothetical protein O181_077040 [Austropuccinia psidii MF-1]|uniref:Integrase catalytic domain-containing protein n=1 Tax=Austropuccinia psidii MF-1 TaxID=1389203 RepID=A0A9Q3IFL3_9BASI|nr:hypothetical protein [Austropuccinia psidii MF-1]
MDTALLLWSTGIFHTGLFNNIISERDPTFTSALWTHLNRLFGTKLSFSTAYHPQTDGLAERMIETSEDMIRRFSYKTSVHSSTGQTPAISDKGWNPRLPADTLKNDLIDIHPTASSFKLILDKAKQHAKQSPKKLKDSYVGPFVIVSLHGTNEVQVELSGELENKHPTSPVSLINPYQPTDKELFPLRNPTPLTVAPVEQDEDKKIKKVIKERILRGKNQREYLVRYRNAVHEDKWLAESEITDSDKLSKRFRHERRPQA